VSAVTVGPISDVCILGTGTAFPARALSNLDVLRAVAPGLWAHRPQPPDEQELRFIAEGAAHNLGIRRRYWAHDVGTPFGASNETSVVELAISAAREAILDAQVTASDLSLVLCATSTPSRMTSTLSSAVGAALGTRVACMDTRSGCAGALFGLTTGALYVAATGLPILLVGAETFSKVIPPNDKRAALTLGDAAGALVLGPSSKGALEAAHLESDGSLSKLIQTDGSLPPTHQDIERGAYFLSGSAEGLAEVVPERGEWAIRSVLSRAQLLPGDVDVFIPHISSVQVLEELCARTDISRAKAQTTFAEHGNVGAAGWMVSLAEARRQKRISAGMKLLISSVGGGLSYAAALLRC
jgi:acetoacetyl-CoA synthase